MNNRRTQEKETTFRKTRTESVKRLHRTLFAVSAAVLLGVAFGCSVDAPTQGRPTTVTQMRSDIDEHLVQLEKTPLNKRYMARRLLDKVVFSQGTRAQQNRYKDLMKNAPIPGKPAAQLTPAMAKLKPAQGG